MDFQAILCTIFDHFKGEKSSSAPYYILQGKRSGQSIQDARNYQLEPFFSILPKLPKDQYDAEIDRSFASGLLQKSPEGDVQVTIKGMELVKKSGPHFFNGWYYRGNEFVFFQRLSLIIQTVSQMIAFEKQFLPIQQDIDIQRFVKGFLKGKHYSTQAFASSIKHEIATALAAIPVVDNSKMIFTYRLTGYKYTGWTWLQLAKALNMHPLDVQLAFIECLHTLLEEIEEAKKYPLLAEVAIDIKLENVLTSSAKQTKILYDQRKTIDEMSIVRRLKKSTIEDHLIEIALNTSDFRIEDFVLPQQQYQVEQYIRLHDTRKLRVLKDTFPELSYFQIRLILAMIGG